MLLNQNQAINIIRNYAKCRNILYSRHFHVSHILHPRKPASLKKTIDFIPLSQKSIDVEEALDHKRQINSNKNFYGIEGDEGVIVVDETSHVDKSTTDINKNKSVLEKEFRVTTFGAVRLDVENEPLHIPKNYKRLRNKSINSDIVAEKQAETLSETKPSNISDEAKQLQNFSDVNKSESPQISDYSNSGGDYFYSLNNSSDKKECAYQSSLQNDKISNYIDNLYFPNEINDKSLSSSEVQQKEHKLSSENNKEQSPNQTASASFIDSFYFSSEAGNSRTISGNNLLGDNPNGRHFQEREHNSNNELIKSASQNKSKPLHDSVANQFLPKNSSNIKQSSASYIDEFYFPEQTIENSTEDNKRNKLNYIDEQYFDKKFLNTYSHDVTKNNISDTEINICTDSINASDVKCHNGISSNVTTGEQVDDYTIHGTMNTKLPSQKISELQLLNVESLDNIHRKSLDKLQNNFRFKTDFIPKTLNSNNKELYKIEAMPPYENLNIKNKSIEVPNKNLNTLNSSIDDSNPETAYDFVKKLREKKFMSDEVKKGISAKKEKKLDSKGFRILKHQVPTLKYFTRDEILKLLKESVLHIDDDIVVLNKPYNLVMHESSTTGDSACLSMYLTDFAKMLDPRKLSPELFTVHRLDKETTGCLLLARNEMSSQRLKSLFAQRKIMKTYWIVTCKVPDPMEGIIDIPISEGTVENKSRMVLHPDLPSEIPYKSHSKTGKRAVTHYKVIATSGNAALVEVKPETGIKHQIRVHFGLGLSCPILGDHKYSYLDKLVPQKLTSDLLQRLRVRQSKVRHIPLHIHSKHIFIPQYSEERNLFVTAPLPHHMSENLRSLKFRKK